MTAEEFKINPEEFLETIYDKITEKLSDSFIDSVTRTLNDSENDLASLVLGSSNRKQKENAVRLALRQPIKSCVNGLIKPLLNYCFHDPNFDYDRLERLWSQVYDACECSSTNNIRPENAEELIGHVKEAFMDYMFRLPLRINKQNHIYIIIKTENGLLVNNLPLE